MTCIFPVVAFGLLSAGLSWGLGFSLRAWFLACQSDPHRRGRADLNGLPRSGGLVVGLAFMTAALFIFLFTDCAALLSWQRILMLLLLVIVPLTMTGLVDDLGSLFPWMRYAMQGFVMALVAIYTESQPYSWLGPIGAISPLIAGGVTIIVLMLIIHAYRTMDRVDGLVTITASLQLGFLAVYLQQPLLLALVTALVGFLPWTLGPAKLTLGETGSTVLGAVVGTLIVVDLASRGQGLSLLSLTLPLTADALYTTGRRLWRKWHGWQPEGTIVERLLGAGVRFPVLISTYLGLTVIFAVNIGIGGAQGGLFNLLVAVACMLLGEAYLAYVKPPGHRP